MRKLTHEEFMKKFSEKNEWFKDIKVLSTYQGGNKKLSCLCVLCNTLFESSPCNLYQNHGCPNCVPKIRKSRWHTHENFLKRFHEKSDKADSIEK